MHATAILLLRRAWVFLGLDSRMFIPIGLRLGSISLYLRDRLHWCLFERAAGSRTALRTGCWSSWRVAAGVALARVFFNDGVSNEGVSRVF